MKWKTRLWRFDSLCEIRGQNEKNIDRTFIVLSPLSFAQEKVSLIDVPLKRLDNQTVSLSQYQGKPLLYQNVGILVSNLLGRFSGN